MNAKGKPDIEAGILGFISSCYQLGSILAVPVAPWYNQKYGRRSSILCGSIIMVIGAILQGFAQHSTLLTITFSPISILI
jgi:MFS family permease